ncbi:MAG: hybrid sensor histidine kinase/response regulator [Epsilonproteobacteria bacterium]|nr:MAG: hybrid sensor histidine kinase/response regulator [Campylobacterota bacterium]
MNFNLSLKNKIFYIFISVITIAISLVGWYGYSTSSKAYIQSAYELSKQRTISVNLEIEGILTTVPKDVLYATEYHALKRFMIWDKMNEKRKTKEWKQIFTVALIDFMEKKENYFKARIMDLNGDEIISVRYDRNKHKSFAQQYSTLQNKKGKRYVELPKKLPKGKFYVSQMNLNVENGQIETPYIPVVRYSTPMIDGNGELIGVFVVNIYADVVLDILEKITKEHEKEGVSYFLVDNNGDYLYHKDKTKRWNTQLGHGSNFNKEHFNIQEKLKGQKSGAFTHNDKIYSFHKVHSLKSRATKNYWYVISAIDSKVALSKLQYFKMIFGLILLSVFIGSFFIIRFYIDKIVTPLSKVTKQLNALSQGEIRKEDIEYDSQDEIGQIVKSTNILVDAIETTINQANLVSNGDFTKDIELLSKNDKLGLAIKDMTKRLKEITLISRKLSQGNYDVKVIPKSSDDEIGIALLETITYYEDIANLAESIANGNIDLTYKSKGTDDRIGHAILQMIKYLKTILNQANAITAEDFSSSIKSKGKDDELGNALITMTEMLSTNSIKNKEEIWFSEGLGEFSDKLTGIDDTVELSKKAISMCSRYVKASSGVIYTFSKDKNELNLISSFAFTSRDSLSNKFKVGEGVIGQVALEKEPILLKNIKDDDFKVQSGTTVGKAKEVFAFPLIHEGELFGVTEIMSFDGFSKLDKEYLLKTANIFSTALHTTSQNVQIKTLLEESQSAFEELQVKSEEMQAQSEELRTSNEQMEEQQLQLEKQSDNLKVKNQEIEKAKSEIDKKADDLEASNQYKSEFLANMSHELRTPLNSVILLSSLLSKNSKENLNDADIQKANVINESGNELLRLINDILDLSKIESGKMELIVDKIDTDNLLKHYDEVFSHTAKDRNLEFKVVDNIKGSFYNDKDRLGQVVRNLVSNALKFTKEGSVTLQLDRIDNAKLPIKVSVKDTGMGIPKEKQELIFKAFTQADGSTSRQFGGTGLGLSISKELSHLMGGKIELESVEGEGAIFSILLPSLDDMHDETAPKVNDIKEIRSHDTILNKKDIVSKKYEQFLIVEDDREFANVLKETIEEHGAKVFVAYDGKDGLAIASKHKIDGAIIDIGLPDMSGVDVIRELKSNSLTKDIHIQVISGQDKADQKLDDLKIDGYLQKPVSGEQISNAISNIVELNADAKSILIVEDDQLHLKAIKDYITEENKYEVDTAISVKEAKELCAEHYYDIAIIDLGLSDGSGVEVCEYITEYEKDTSILIYTGRDLTIDEANFLNDISDEIIIKNPNSHERLKDEVDRFLTTPHQTVNERFKHHIEEVEDVDYSSYDTDTLKGKSVLIVDDDIKNIFVLSSALQEYDMDISHAKNGKEALELLRENPNIDIVLMDIMMPIMNGYEAMEAIRADDKLKHLPIIAVTAKAMQKDREAALKSGADDYLTKPIDLEKLSSMMAMWVNK